MPMVKHLGSPKTSCYERLKGLGLIEIGDLLGTDVNRVPYSSSEATFKYILGIMKRREFPYIVELKYDNQRDHKVKLEAVCDFFAEMVEQGWFVDKLTMYPVWPVERSYIDMISTYYAGMLFGFTDEQLAVKLQLMIS